MPSISSNAGRKRQAYPSGSGTIAYQEISHTIVQAQQIAAIAAREARNSIIVPAIGLHSMWPSHAWEPRR
jgi:hypothetical protein